MTEKKEMKEAKNPLLLRNQRLMEAFAKSDDERDFYLDRQEGFIIYVDLDKSVEQLEELRKELTVNAERYRILPKMTFYESKKIMEGFIHEKVYDIDTKEKLLDIIQAKEARENFLEFLYDQHTELEKWQQYYQERSRVRIIEWLRNNHFIFVFEEDLDLGISIIDKLKTHLFDDKVPKDVQSARKALTTKAKSYYSNEALNPRPKRGRPPKQAQKTEQEPQVSHDIFLTVPSAIRPFHFTPDISQTGAASFSSKFDTEEEMIASIKQTSSPGSNNVLDTLNQKLNALRNMSSKWLDRQESPAENDFKPEKDEPILDEDELIEKPKPKKASKKEAKKVKKDTKSKAKTEKKETKSTSKAKKSTPKKSK